MRINHAGSYFSAKEPHGRKQLLNSAKYLHVGWHRHLLEKEDTYWKHFSLKSSTSIVYKCSTPGKSKALIKYYVL